MFGYQNWLGDALSPHYGGKRFGLALGTLNVKNRPPSDSCQRLPKIGPGSISATISEGSRPFKDIHNPLVNMRSGLFRGELKINQFVTKGAMLSLPKAREWMCSSRLLLAGYTTVHMAVSTHKKDLFTFFQGYFDKCQIWFILEDIFLSKGYFIYFQRMQSVIT